MRSFLLVLAIAMPTGELLASGTVESGISFKQLIDVAHTKSPDVQIANLETRARISESRSSYGRLAPEIGVEGGARSNREMEKRNDLFYYGYARLELSLKEIFDLKAALHRKDAAELERSQITAKTERVLADLFYAAVLLQEQVSLRKEDIELTEKQIAQAKKRVSGGLATDTDLLEFAMHQQEARNDLEVLEQELQRELRELERFSGLNKIEKLSADFIAPKVAPNFDEVWARVQNSNLELRKAKSESGVARSEKSSVLGAYLPKLSAEAQYGKLMETDFIESRKNSWAVVGKVTVPLFNGLSSWNQYQAKSYESEKASVSEAQTTVRLKNLTSHLIEKIERLKRKVDGETANVSTASKYYQAVVSEYRRGVKNSPDMAGATDKLFAAKLRLLETERDLSITTMELLALQGKSLEEL